jgi:GDP-4-dehydro-6-deoxy-D-mannose reductase
LASGGASGVPVIVTRSFNHTGPGQRPEFVAPALARRVLQARRARARTVSVGNIDVRRDISDVRDIARAYRLLLEGLVNGSIAQGTIVNVGSGRAVSIREVLEGISRAAQFDIEPEVDASLVRPDDPPLVVANIERLQELTDWAPAIALNQTLADLVASLK